MSYGPGPDTVHAHDIVEIDSGPGRPARPPPRVVPTGVECHVRAAEVDRSPAHQNVTFPSTGTTAHGYLALPPSGRGPGVIVIQEWWGLTDHIANVADRLAAEGFVALAPDLYGGNVAHESEEAFRMMKELPVSRGVELLSGAVDHLLGLPEVTSDTVGAVGFCMGGASSSTWPRPMRGSAPRCRSTA